MPMATEEQFTTRPIKTSREPVGPTNAASPSSVGDQALRDALAIVIGAWIVLFLIGFSLRGHSAS